MTIVNTKRTFGVEIEFNRTQDSCTLNELQRRLHIALTSENYTGCWNEVRYTHRVMDQWKVVTDVSVSGGEVVSPPLSIEDNGFEQIEIVCRVIQRAGFSVRGTNTGLHVHHDANDLTVRQLGHIYGTYASFQTLISSSLAPSRRINASHMRPEDYNRLPEQNKNANAWNKPRYNQVKHWANTFALQDLCQMTNKGNYHGARYDSTVNFQSLAEHGTIEFRQHQGTLNAKKIISWVLVTQAFIERFVQHKMTWIAPNADYKTGQWRMFLRALNVAHSYTKLHPDAQVYTDAFNFMKSNIKKFANQQS
jgi:hypothetical protein